MLTDDGRDPTLHPFNLAHLKESLLRGVTRDIGVHQ